MILKYLAKSAVISLGVNKMRSVLTILGIVIGIAAIILVQSIGFGAQELILNQIRSFGSKTIAVEPGREPKGPSDFTSVFLDSLKEVDFKALQNNLDSLGLTSVVPIAFMPVVASREGETQSTTIIGSGPEIERILDISPEEGLFFSEEDVLSRSSVVIIGAEVKKELFGDDEALGEKIRIKNRNYQVVGIFSAKGQIGFLNIDGAILAPHTTVREYVTGNNYYNEFILEVEDEKYIETTKQNVANFLRELHGITDPDKDDFHIMTQDDMVKTVSAITGILSALLVSVAAISLIVGGVGIMNIMLVSVTERTREIGLRKALGATGKNILHQFIFESVLLTLIGGFFGIVFGALFAFLASFILSRFVAQNWSFTFPLSAALVGFLVSFLVGLVFGLYPAKQASQKSPIEALRYE